MPAGRSKLHRQGDVPGPTWAGGDFLDWPQFERRNRGSFLADHQLGRGCERDHRWGDKLKLQRKFHRRERDRLWQHVHLQPNWLERIFLGGTCLFTPVLSSDGLGTILGNPFIATPGGSWSFYANNSRYDVTTSAGGPSLPITLGRVLFADLLGQNAITAYKINTKILVDNNRFLTPEAALAACPASPIGCYVEHTDFSSTSAGFTVGGTPSVNYFGQKFELYPGARIDVRGKVSLAFDGGVLFGDDFVSSLLIAGGSFPGATPLVDVGDGVNLLTEQLWNLRLNANLVPGITGIRIRGFNDSSGVWNTTTQNYMANCISMDGTNVLVNNFIMVNNTCAGATGAGDAISLNNINGGELFARTTTASNSGSQIAGAGLHIAGTSTTGATHTDISITLRNTTTATCLMVTDRSQQSA